MGLAGLHRAAQSDRANCTPGVEAFLVAATASRSVYFPGDLNEHERSIQGIEFCISPVAHYSWWHKGRDSLTCDSGPCNLSGCAQGVWWGQSIKRLVSLYLLGLEMAFRH